MSPIARFGRFNAVGALGMGLQLLIVSVLVQRIGVHPVAATAVAIVTVVVHNFCWHVRWTWRDQIGPGVSLARAFARFVLANGLVSFVGSILMMPILLAAGLTAIAANLVTIVACGLLNYWAAGRVFRRRQMSRAGLPFRVAAPTICRARL